MLTKRVDLINEAPKKKKRRNIKKIGKDLNLKMKTLGSLNDQKKKKRKKKNNSKNLPIKQSLGKIKINGKPIGKLTKSKSTSQIRRKSLIKKNGRTGKKVRISIELIASQRVDLNPQTKRVGSFGL